MNKKVNSLHNFDIHIYYDSREVHATAPEATLVIPVYNVAEYLEDCLSSVFATAKSVDLEVIIIDDGSTDSSARQISEFLDNHKPQRTVFIWQPNRGLSSVRNRGVSLATGDYVGFLDSDDMISVGTMRTLLDFARMNNCEIVLGKSLVFDSKSDKVFDFYDAWVWDRMLGGASTRVISKHEEPALFFLEPNANYRLVRKDMFERYDLNYPEGYYFEDPPVHYRMLSSANRIGLVKTPYYWYRVNRPGKITAERSHRRFDIITVARETLIILSPLDVTPMEGGAILYGLTRIVWWCGCMTLPEHRQQFIEQACDVFMRHAPPAWVLCFGHLHFPDEIIYLVLGALLRGKRQRLLSLSYNKRKPISTFFFLLTIGRKDVVVRRLRKLLGSIVGKLRRMVV